MGRSAPVPGRSNILSPEYAGLIPQPSSRRTLLQPGTAALRFGCGSTALRLCVKISSATVLVYFVTSFFILPSLPCTRQNSILRAAPNGCKLGGVKTSVDLDPELQDEVDKTVSLIREKPATVLRMAIRAGLPLIASRFQAPRPDGYFAGDYPLPDDRLALEAAMANLPQSPDR